MNDRDRLIHRHLEGSLSEEEAAEFTELLREDSELRRRLAEMAFDQVQLRDLLKTSRSAPSRSFSRWISVAAALLLITGLTALLLVMNPEPDHEIISGRVEVDGTVADHIKPEIPLSAIGREPAVIRFADGTTIELDPSSVFSFPRRFAKSRSAVELKRGSGRFIVVPDRRPFEVQTAMGTIRTTEGEFEVEVDGDRLIVLAVDKPVEIIVSGAVRRVPAGERITFEGPQHLDAFEGVVRGRITAWKKNLIQLEILEVIEGEPLAAGWVVQVTASRKRLPDVEDQVRKLHAPFLWSLKQGEELVLDIRHFKGTHFSLGNLTPEQVERAQSARRNPRRK